MNLKNFCKALLLTQRSMAITECTHITQMGMRQVRGTTPSLHSLYDARACILLLEGWFRPNINTAMWKGVIQIGVLRLNSVNSRLERSDRYGNLPKCKIIDRRNFSFSFFFVVNKESRGSQSNFLITELIEYNRTQSND